jgi:phosphate transport system substrate-binding protein
MQTNSGKSGKCSNFGNCSLADARVTIEVPSGLDFVCNECGKPLLQTDGGGAPAGGSKALLMGLGLGALLLAGGGAVWLLGKKTPEPQPPAVLAAPPAAPPVPVPAPVSVPAVTPAPEKKSAAPLTGTCSDADERAGLCRTR